MSLAEYRQPERESAPITDHRPRCWRCGRVLAWLMTRPWRVDCGRCKAANASPPAPSA